MREKEKKKVSNDNLLTNLGLEIAQDSETLFFRTSIKMPLLDVKQTEGMKTNDSRS